MVRQAHHNPEPGRRANYNDRSANQTIGFDLILDFDIVIWNLFGPILRSGSACNLLFPVYPSRELANPSNAFRATATMN
jgi:hypothetical protein